MAFSMKKLQEWQMDILKNPKLRVIMDSCWEVETKMKKSINANQNELESILSM